MNPKLNPFTTVIYIIYIYICELYNFLEPKVVNTEKLGEISMEKEYRQLRADREARTTYRMTQYVEEGLTQEEIKEREKAARKPEIDAKKKYQKERMDRKEEKLRRKIARGY